MRLRADESVKAAGLVGVQVALILLLLAVPRPRWHAGTHAWVLAPGLLFFGAGAVVSLYGLVSLGRSLSPLPAPRRGGRLLTTGAYRRVRHPIYSGGLLAALGLVVAAWAPLRLLWWALLALVLDVKSRYEEELLSKEFPDYAAYKRMSWRFVPRVY